MCLICMCVYIYIYICILITICSNDPGQAAGQTWGTNIGVKLGCQSQESKKVNRSYPNIPFPQAWLPGSEIERPLGLGPASS